MLIHPKSLLIYKRILFQSVRHWDTSNGPDRKDQPLRLFTWWNRRQANVSSLAGSYERIIIQRFVSSSWMKLGIDVRVRQRRSRRQCNNAKLTVHVSSVSGVCWDGGRRWVGFKEKKKASQRLHVRMPCSCGNWRRWIRPLVALLYVLLLIVVLPLCIWELQKSEVSSGNRWIWLIRGFILIVGALMVQHRGVM